ncbi:MAG: hypothetical protein LBE14_06375 [Treponema sp.]|nr:hypothetical protein [Treponema sp.]
MDEKTIIIGGNSAWDAAEKRSGLIELTLLRPHPVLALSSAAAEKTAPAENRFLDLALSFDEGRPELFTDQTGHYRVMVNPRPDSAGNAAIQAADRRWARAGTGAALFSGAHVSTGTGGAGSPLMIEPRTGDALFAPDSQIRDFTLEFWLYPLNMANGEQILTWISSRPLPRQEDTAAMDSGGEYAFQRLQCIAVKNRLQWTFLDLFANSGGSRHISLTLSGDTPVVPKTWSHHLIRFDSDTGLLEYLVNGKAEAIEYATATRREGGEVYTPLMGEGGSFMLGNRFMGLLDEFKIYRAYIGSAETRKYSPRGGRMETRPIDLGQGSSGILKVEALGGRTSVSGGIVQNDYAGYEGPFSGGGAFRFADDSALQFFIRTADSPYAWTGADWRPFIPGTELAGNLRGRYVQFAVDFYPSGDCETSPYLEEIRVTYRPDEPPVPPSRITAVARDGAVALNWKPSPDTDTLGYVVYYGTSRGEYFGEGAVPGASPINAGKRTALRIDGLENGVLYYFAVAAYDRWNRTDDGRRIFHTGEFSREVSARPLPEPLAFPGEAEVSKAAE